MQGISSGSPSGGARSAARSVNAVVAGLAVAATCLMPAVGSAAGPFGPGPGRDRDRSRNAEHLAEIDKARSDLTTSVATAFATGNWTAATNNVDRIRRALLALETPPGADARSFAAERTDVDWKAFAIRGPAERGRAGEILTASREFDGVFRTFREKWFPAAAPAAGHTDPAVAVVLAELQDAERFLASGDFRRLGDTAESVQRKIDALRAPPRADDRRFESDRRSVSYKASALRSQARDRDREDARDALGDLQTAFTRFADNWYKGVAAAPPPPPGSGEWRPGDDRTEFRELFATYRDARRAHSARDYAALATAADTMRTQLFRLDAPAGADATAFAADKRSLSYRARALSRAAGDRSDFAVEDAFREFDAALATFTERHFRRPGGPGTGPGPGPATGREGDLFEPPAAFSRGVARRTAIWKDEMDVWRVRSTSDRDDATITVTIGLIGGRFSEVNGVRVDAFGRGSLVTNFTLIPTGNQVTFSGRLRNSVEGISFRVDGNVRAMQIDVTHDGQRRSTEVLIGGRGTHPTAVPFQLSPR